MSRDPGVRSAVRRIWRSIRMRAAGEYQRAEIFRGEGARIGERTRLLVMDLGTEPYLVSIGDDTLVSSEVLFVTHDGATWVGRDAHPNLNVFGPVTVGRRCFIGTRAVLLPGTVIGDRCIVAAGAVVRGSFAGGSVIGGVPARVISTTEEYLARAQANSLDVDFRDRALLRQTLEAAFFADDEHR